MKRILFILLISLFNTSFAQTLSHKTLSSGGAQYSGSNFSLNSSAGISFGSTLSAGGYQLTQGFQQPVWKFFKDQDGDLFGNRDSFLYDFVQPLGYVLDSTDCNDFDSSIHNITHLAQITGNTNLIVGTNYSFTDSTAKGHWHLSNTNLASIDTVGNLVAIAAGTDTLFYSIQNACGITRVFKVLHITSPCLPSYVPTNGLVGWWPFCGNANDESGNGNNGTVNGATLTQDRFGNAGKAYDFDGALNTNIAVNLNSSIIGTRTYSVWVKYPVSYINPYSHLITCSNSSNDYLSTCGNHGAYVAAGVVGKFYDGKSGLMSNNSLNDLDWHQIILTANYNTYTSNLYIDGQFVGSNYSSNYSSNPLVNQIVFGSVLNAASYANPTVFGQLDDIGIWNRALTPAEIQALYLSGQPCTVTHTTSLNICRRDSTLWNGHYYSHTGIDTVHLTSYRGCDSVDILNLNVYPLYYNVITQYFCQGDSIVFNGQHIKNAGTYFFHFTSITGCDSTVRLRALFYPKTVTKINLNICLNSTVSYGGQTFSNAGVYAQHFVNHYGCDSVVQITITKRLPNITAKTLFKCSNDSILYLGSYYRNPGIYSVHLTNKYGCDSLIKLTVLNYPGAAPVVVKQYICPGSSAQYAGNSYSTPGKYSVHLTSRFGCDSLIQLAVYFYPQNVSSITIYRCSNDSVLYNNKYYSQNGIYSVHLINKYGCDSLINLQVLSRPITSSIQTRYKCSTDSVLYNGNYYRLPGTYTIRLQNRFSCDSIVSLRILNYPSTSSNITIGLCQGSSVYYNGIQYTQAGIYAQHFISSNGCDSIVQVTVTKLPSSYTSITKYRCSNDSVLYNGTYYNSNGLFQIHLTNKYGCDSLINLQVLSLPISSKIITYTKCKSDSVLYHNNYYSQAGTYFVRLTNYLGCDSLITLRILNYPNTVTYINRSICVGGIVMYNGVQYTQAGIYAQHFTNHYGCDSIVQITVSKLTSSYSNLTLYKCPNDSVLYNGYYYSFNGLYTIRYTNYLNCDSIVRLMVLTYPTSYSIYTHYICQGDSLLYHGNYYKQTGTYFIHLTNRYGCDSTVRLRLLYNNSSSLTNVTLCQAQTYTWNGITYTWNMPGTYTRHFINWKGCDSIATLKIYKGNCKESGEAIGTTITTTVETNAAETTTATSLEATPNFEMRIYPNPTTGRFVLENNCTSCKQMHIELMTLDGKLLYAQDADNSTGKINIDLQLPSGMYWVKMSNGAEGFGEVRRVIIEN